MELLVILAYSKPARGGYVSGTLWRIVTVTAGTTRADVLRWAIEQLPPDMRGANITFFSAEPNRFQVDGAR